MKFFEFFQFVSALAALLVITCSQAQTAPGEDPVTLTEKITHNMLPLNNTAQVGTKPFQEMPAWMDAKIARFTAKAFSADVTGILTDESVATTVTTDGMRKVCAQDVGNSIAPQSAASNARLGMTAPLAVVLRGDLINICR